VIFMVMTLRAADSQAKPDRTYRGSAVHHLLVAELLNLHAAFAVGQCVAMESGSDLLIDSRVWQQIACDLLDGELIERHVTTDGIDHPLAVTPGVWAHVIFFVAVAIGVASQVQARARR